MKIHSLSPLIGACALVATGCVAQTATSLPPQQAALVRATCEKIMRVGRTIALSACSEALTDSLVAHEQGYVAVQGDRTCSSQGLKPGTAEFATCVLDHRRQYASAPMQVAANGTAPRLTYDPSKDVGASQDYYDASFDTKRRREEYSCAQLGLDPDSGEFGQCVAGLDANLFNVDHPNP